MTTTNSLGTLASASTTLKVLPPQTPRISIGLGSILGAGVTLAGAAGAVVAAVQGKDLPAVTAAGAGLVAALGTLGARTAQTIAMIRHGAKTARPYVEAAFDALDDPETDSVRDADLPADDVELASPPPDETNTPVQPSQAGLTEG